MSVEFTTRNGLPSITVRNEAAEAEIMLLGAHIVSYRHTGNELLWMSERSFFEEGKPIRGGIPVCWPWFGPNPSDSSLPAHGIARIHTWTFRGSEEPDARRTTIRLTLTDSPETRTLWNHAFELTYEASIGDTLDIALTTRNTGESPITITEALHTYFRVRDIALVSVLGLEGKAYLEKAGGQSTPCSAQDGAVTFDREVDRVYRNAPGPLTLVDASEGRRIRIETAGSNSAVTWNPWVDKSIRMSADFPPEGYKTMVCVETANALDDARTILPGASHTLRAAYSLR